MTGFPAADQAIVKRELEAFLEDSGDIIRRTSTKVKGDYNTTENVVHNNVPCRVQPITPLGTEKTRLKAFPASIVEKAEYLVTLSSDYAYEAHDQLDVNGVRYNLIAIRFDNATWNPTVRAVAVRVE